MYKPTREKLLKELRRVAAAIPEKELCMRSVEEQGDCGTTRCLLGWCYRDPWFRKHTKIAAFVTSVNKGTYRGADRIKYNTHLPDTITLCLAGSTGLADVFAIPYDYCQLLFGLDAEQYDDIRAVSKAEILWNIDELIAGRPVRAYAGLKNSVAPYVPRPN